MLRDSIVTSVTSLGDGVRTAAETVRTTAPSDDAGAETADRYEWQAAMATADALACYLRTLDPNTSATATDLALICELHEDWVLIDGVEAEIVSAKHKESSFGAFTTLRSLLDDGGVLHLYLRWQALGKMPRCRLVTSAGLSGPPRDFVAACEGLRRDGHQQLQDVADVVTAFETALNTALDEDDHASRDEVLTFMSSLCVEHSRPRRDHIHGFGPAAFAGPVVARLGASEAAGAVWNAVLMAVRERMRAAGPRERGALPTVLGARDEGDHKVRTLTMGEMETLVSVALRHTQAYRPLPRVSKSSRVALKMAEGGCSDNAIERAEALRIQNRRYWRGRASAPGVEAERESVLNRLRQIADEATDEVLCEGENWGPLLWRRLASRTESFAKDERAHGLDADLLLGGLSELSNRCEVWFSDRFDVDARKAQVLGGESI